MNKQTSIKQTLLHYVSDELLHIFTQIPDIFFNGAEEIRLRADKPVLISHKDGEFFVDREGKLLRDITQGFCPDRVQVAKCLELMSNYSMYAFEEELKNGYLTLPGGHRAGITGKTVLSGGSVKTMKNINGLNIRISREVKGCSDGILPFLLDKNGSNVLHTMIISPPGCGKTTLLRDIVRHLSSGVPGLIAGQTVAVADERSEIAGCYLGVPQNDIGPRTDVLDGCPKAEGMMLLLRSMSPKIIAVDEIGRQSDITAIEEVINGGITLICTVHGYNLDEISKRDTLAALLSKKIFNRFIILEKPGGIPAIYNEKHEKIVGEGTSRAD